MSFYTSLTYYRPSEPPAMTAEDLGQFITRIRDAGFLTDDGFRLLHVRFGDSIDQDDNGTSCDEEIAPGLSTMGEFEWDLNLTVPGSIQEIVDALVTDKHRIYRAHVSLGTPIDAILQPITRINSPENELDFRPNSLSIDIGPIEIYNLECDFRAFVGWIGLSLSGSGYLFPWTSRQVLQRLDNSPMIQHVTELCRSFWPVAPNPVEDRMVDVRKQLGELWPYEKLDKPWDWYWGIQESG